MILQFIKSLKTSWAIVPTWKHVSEEATRCVSWKQECIVEIWPGTWVFTKKILEKSPHSTTICIEINKDFVDIMQRDYPQAYTYHDDATQLEKYITKHGFTSCNRVISWLPWASFYSEQQEDLLKCIYWALKNGWTFSTFSYTWIHKMPKWKSFYKILCEIFGERNIQKSQTYLSNIPPAFVYHCTKW